MNDWWWQADKRASGWWLTNGTESFRMVSEFVARELVTYLNVSGRCPECGNAEHVIVAVDQNDDDVTEPCPTCQPMDDGERERIFRLLAQLRWR